MAELQRRHQNSPLSTTTALTPALPTSSSSSSSSSSSRTITPPGNTRPPHRVSSSGTVQVVSPVATSVTALSQTESFAWSPASRIYDINSEIGSSTSIAGHNQCGQGQQQQQNRSYVLGGVLPHAARQPFWWMDSSAIDLPRHGENEQDCLLDYTTRGGNEVKMQRAILHTVMHGVVLALQSGVSLAVLALFVWISLWKDEEGGLSGISGGVLNNVPSLATTFVLIVSSTTLVVHEIYILSPVVLLYLQAAILALTTVSTTGMWMTCVGEDDAMLKCVLISCSVFFLGTCGLAFLRAVVIWKVTSSDESEGLGQVNGDREVRGENYATFQRPESL